MDMGKVGSRGMLPTSSFGSGVGYPGLDADVPKGGSETCTGCMCGPLCSLVVARG